MITAGANTEVPIYAIDIIYKGVWWRPPHLANAEAVQRFSEALYSGFLAGLVSSLVTSALIGFLLWRFTTRFAERQIQKGNYFRLFYGLTASNARIYHRHYSINDIGDAINIMVHYVDIINSIELEGFNRRSKVFQGILNRFRTSYINLINNPLTRELVHQNLYTEEHKALLQPYVDQVDNSFKELYKFLDEGYK